MARRFFQRTSRSGLAARFRLNYTAGVGHVVDPALPQEADRKNGAIAQLGERFNGIEEVVGSIPSGSTKFLNKFNQLENFGSTSFVEREVIKCYKGPTASFGRI